MKPVIELCRPLRVGRTVTVTAGSVTVEQITNDPIRGRIRIVKTDSVSGKPLPGATFTVTIIPDDPMGDLDGDGEVTINDATLLLACLAEFQELDDAQRVLADVNRDGRVDVRDVTAIQRILAEIDI